MSELDEAMLRRIRQITCKEDRPFTYKDLLRFKLDEIEHKMTHGTFRNKISKLIDAGKVELYCYSGIGFYTLKGHKFRNSLKGNRTLVTMSSNPRSSDDSSNYNSSKRSIAQMIQSVPLDNQCIHDIRLRFEVPFIYDLVEKDKNLAQHKRKRSEDIPFPIHIPIASTDNISIQVIIHKSDTVSLILGCTFNPISLDHDGLIRFYTTLVRIEEQLTYYLESCYTLVAPNPNTFVPSVPSYKHWIITMWHFGKDSLIQYSGKMFNIEFEQANNIISRIYSKQWKNKKKIRMEVQEYPNKSIEELIQQRIYTYESY